TVLAQSHALSGYLLRQTGKPAEALRAYQKVLAIWQKLADANPAVGKHQSALAQTHNHIGLLLLMWMGKPEEALTASRKALALQKRLAEAFTALEKGLAILQKLAKADPDHAFLRRTLGEGHAFRGEARARAGQPAEAAADLRRALELWATVPSLDIEIQVE